MTAPEKIFVTVEYIGKTDTVVCGAFGTYPMDESVEFTRTDLSQAAVAAALEAAAGAIRKRGQTEIETAYPPLGASTQAFYEAYDIIRALITPSQHEALAAHVAAEVAKARAVEASVNAENEACAKMLDNEADDYEADASRFRGGTDPHHFRMNLASTARKYAAAIRSRKGDAL